MTIQLEVGKFYMDRSGRKMGPIRAYNSSAYPFAAGNCTYTVWGGLLFSGVHDVQDLVSEWVKPKVEPKVEPELTPFGKLTPEEQGALLLAHLKGKTIQAYSGFQQDWITMKTPCYWYDGQPYRIKPKVNMQDEYWVEFSTLGKPIYVHTYSPDHLTKDYGYIVHHPAVEMKETA